MTPKQKRDTLVAYDSSTDDIIACALRNDFDGVDEILAAEPARINAQRRENGLTALMAASGRGLDRMVGHLLSKSGIDTSLVDFHGRDALAFGRPFPNVVKRIMLHRNPDMTWTEPRIHPV